MDIKGGWQSFPVVLRLAYRSPNVAEEINSSLWEEMNKAGRYSQVCVVGNVNFRNVT